jgi:HD-GYP domain-containing protein (c-di-GMP phosphodiesterase class II)
MAAFNAAARAYILGVLLLAAATVAFAAITLDWAAYGLDVAFLALLMVVGTPLFERVGAGKTSISLGSVVVLAAILIVGPRGAVVVAAADVAVLLNSRGWVKPSFNVAQWVLSAGVAGAVYAAAGGTVFDAAGFPRVLFPALLADVVLCLVNGLLIAIVLYLAEGVPIKATWFGKLGPQVLAYLGYGLFGLLFAVLWIPVELGPLAALLLLVPFIVARWTYSQYAEQQASYDRTVRALVAAVETKDYYTRGHSERVAKASVLIARVIGIREDRVESLRYAGILHDLGKLGVPTRVLQKSGELTEEEYAAIQLHPVRGLELVRDIDFLQEAVAGIVHHHERLDGRGYPSGLVGDQIPEFARVIAVADAFDSMTSTRSYRHARSVEGAIAELRRCAGTQFDPVMVDALVGALRTYGWIGATPVQGDGPPAHLYDHDDPAAAVVVGGGLG